MFIAGFDSVREFSEASGEAGVHRHAARAGLKGVRFHCGSWSPHGIEIRAPGAAFVPFNLFVRDVHAQVFEDSECIRMRFIV